MADLWWEQAAAAQAPELDDDRLDRDQPDPDEAPLTAAQRARLSVGRKVIPDDRVISMVRRDSAAGPTFRFVPVVMHEGPLPDRVLAALGQLP